MIKRKKRIHTNTLQKVSVKIKREFTGGATANIKEVIMDIYNWE